MAVDLKKTTSVVNNLAPRFPLKIYGWRNVIAANRPENNGGQIVYRPKLGDQYFECYFSSRSIQQQLESEGIPATVLHLRIPIDVGKIYHHYMVQVEDGEQRLLAGFSPFDKYLGIDGSRHFERAQYSDFIKGFSVKNVEPETEEECLQIRQFPNRFYFPFGFHQFRDEEVLTELGVEGNWTSLAISLRASQLKFDQPSQSLVRLGRLSLTLALTRENKEENISSDYIAEMSSHSCRWQFDRQPYHYPQEKSIMLREAVQNDWPVFAKLIGEVAESIKL